MAQYFRIFRSNLNREPQLIKIFRNQHAQAIKSDVNQLNVTMGINLTDSSARRLKQISSEGQHFLRILVDNGGCSGFQYKFQMENSFKNDDLTFGPNNCVIIDPISMEYCAGSTLDFHTDIMRSGFKMINNPKAEQGCSCGVSFAPKLD